MGLKQVRKRRGLTQVELAEAAGIQQTLISYLERQPDPNPKWHTVRALMRALDAHPNELFRPTPLRKREAA